MSLFHNDIYQSVEENLKEEIDKLDEEQLRVKLLTARLKIIDMKEKAEIVFDEINKLRCYYEDKCIKLQRIIDNISRRK